MSVLAAFQRAMNWIGERRGRSTRSRYAAFGQSHAACFCEALESRVLLSADGFGTADIFDVDATSDAEVGYVTPGGVVSTAVEERIEGFAAMGASETQGDSFSNSWVPYAVEMGLNFGGESNPFNVAVGGANTRTLLVQGQHTNTAQFVADGLVDVAFLSIGGNDMRGQTAGAIANGVLDGAELTARIDSWVDNIETAVDTVLAEHPEGLVVLGVTDLTLTPQFRSTFPAEGQQTRVLDALEEFNDGIFDVANSRGLVYVDTFASLQGLNDLPTLEVGGVEIDLVTRGTDPTHFFQDRIHPGPIGNALFANQLVAAVNEGFDTSYELLSDLDILTSVGLEGSYIGETFSPLIVYEDYVVVPEDDGTATWSVSATSENVAEDSAGTESAIFSLSGTIANGAQASVQLKLEDVTTDPSDYQNPGAAVVEAVNAYSGPGSLSISRTGVLTYTGGAGGTSMIDLLIPVVPIDDDLVEGDESFTVSLSNPTGAEIGQSHQTVTIIDNDQPIPATWSVSATSPTIAEDAPGKESIIFSLSGELDEGEQASVQLNLEDVTTDPSDYQSPGAAVVEAVNAYSGPGSLSVSRTGVLTYTGGTGGTSMTDLLVPIQPVDDADIEDTESFEVFLTDPAGATLDAAQSTITIHILDNDGTAIAREWALTSTSPTIAEDAAGSESLIISLSGSFADGQQTSVQLNVQDITTTGGQGSPAESGLYADPVFGVQKTSNLIYGQGAVDNGAGVKDLKLDVYQPTNIGVAVPNSRPTIMFIHGGGWRKGTRRLAESQGHTNSYVTRGYNLVSISYRLAGDIPPLTAGPANDYPILEQLGDGKEHYEPVDGGLTTTINASLEDANLALDWIYANAALYGFDTDRIAILGSSAGAVNAMAMGHLVQNENVDPKAVISNVGALFNETSPFTPGGPPTLLIAGERDNTVPAAWVELTRDQMNEVGIETEYYLKPNAGHPTDWETVIDGQTLRQHSFDFLYNNLAGVTTDQSDYEDPAATVLQAVNNYAGPGSLSFNANSGVLTYTGGAGGTSMSDLLIPIAPIDDDLVEGDESFTVSLLNPTGAQLGQSQQLVTILDNDGNLPVDATIEGGEGDVLDDTTIFDDGEIDSLFADIGTGWVIDLTAFS